ncbi:orotate phosphoribosyltransferase [Brucepastera parasyntrophica]|uniref:orotate phosphoribosyltransferase n=1 Tax=Brucepastera parasyntrophica TaxID=2880008 RepID=UPI00210C2619|nr:orotate phosphoribosyltransferase [Brucepastera parasyntrophica]ULQ59288.1 orotate phosphoribosyltransferase [Brucepastera parasyntrophica]
MSDVVSILEECGALLTGHFLLSSGKHSSQYFQCARLLQFPDRAAEVISSITEKISADKNISQADSVIGPAMGGIIVAYELGRQLGKPAFFTERDDEGKMTLRRGFEIAPGEKIIIAEDVVTTGKSALETAERIKDMGGEVVASVCIVDRRPESAENPFPWPLFSAVRIPAVLFDPDDCPLCREGKLPPVKPGSRKVF